MRKNYVSIIVLGAICYFISLISSQFIYWLIDSSKLYFFLHSFLFILLFYLFIGKKQKIEVLIFIIFMLLFQNRLYGVFFVENTLAYKEYCFWGFVSSGLISLVFYIITNSLEERKKEEMGMLNFRKNKNL